MMMAGATKPSRSSELSAGADEALLRGDLFAAERAALKALLAARQENDFARMATIASTLMEARLRRVKAATDTKRIGIIDTPVSEDVRVTKGCYLVQPPQVGADARRMRLAAIEQEVPAMVLCREPLTQIKLLPIVALSPGVTVRTKVMPPKNMDKPDMAWFLGALEALGVCALQTIDPTHNAIRRVDAIIERLDAIPEHEGLHHALQQACLEAKAEYEQMKSARGARKATAPKAADADDDDDGVDGFGDADGE